MEKVKLSGIQRVAWILGGCLFGLLCIFHALVFRADPLVSFRGIEMQGADAEYHYAARVNEIRDGFPLASNVYYTGNKNQPYLQPPLPEWTVAHIGELLGLDTARSMVVCQWLFGTMVFTVMVGAFFAMTKRFWWSFMGVSVALAAGYLFSGPGMLLRLLENTAGQLEFLTFARPINPQWSVLLFFGALWALQVWLERHSRRALVLVGILTVAAFYSYVYTWTLLGGIYALIGLRALFRRDWQRVKELGCLAVGILITTLPYFWNVWRASQHPFYHETAMRLGLVAQRHPSGGIFLLTLCGLAIFTKKFWQGRGEILQAFAVTAVAVLNQQIITGQAIVSAHYHWYFIKPLVVVSLIIVAGTWIEPHISRRLHTVSLPLLALVVATGTFAAGTLYQVRAYESARPFWSEQQAAAGALEYVRSHLKPGDVVYAQGFIRDLVPVYTSADVYWAINAYTYLSSDQRAADAYFFDLWMAGVSAEEVARAFPTTRRAELSSRIHAIYAREAFGDSRAIPDQEVEKYVRDYQAFLSLTDEDKLRLYPLGYVIISHQEVNTPALLAIRGHSDSIYRDEVFEIRRMRVDFLAR